MGLFVRSSEKTSPAASVATGAPRAEAKREPVFVNLPAEAEAEAPVVVKVADPALTPERVTYLQQLKHRIHQQLVERLDVQNLRAMPQNIVRQEVSVLVRDLCRNEKGLLSSGQMEKLMEEVMDETFGLGPLESL
ncbi:MAG: hypothetical protein H7Z14_00260, partial [Anaerolineae bacterium]|nr:hypothetical protein [Phycisphaerae bacterium]